MPTAAEASVNQAARPAVHIHQIYIKAEPGAIWDAITSPEWNGRYGYRGVSHYELAFRAGRMDELLVHPTVKPVALVADAMRDCSRRDDIVLDPFMGSGTTILAAERVGRRAYGLELDPLYVDAAIRRWQKLTKRDAVLEETGQTFDEIAEDGRKTAPPAKSRRRK